MTSPRPAQFGFGGGMFGRPPRATLGLMIATGVVSILGMASAGRFGEQTLLRQLYFSPSQVLDGWKIWTPFTYLFLSVEPFELLLYIAFGLWIFASSVERQWGTRRFLYYFFGTGTGAAVLTTALGAFIPALRPNVFSGPMVAGDAVLLGWVLMNWNATAYFIVVPVRAPWLLVIVLLIPALNIIRGAWEPFVPVLLGMGIGYLMLKRSLSPRRAYLHFRAWWIEKQLKRKARHLRVVPKPDRDREPPKYLH